MKRLLDGALLGAGFVVVVTVAFAIAWAGDVFTIDKDGTLKFAVNDQGKITVGATESYVNLVIQNDEVAAEAANTWYYVWVVTNNTGTSTNGLLSTTTLPPSPTPEPAHICSSWDIMIVSDVEIVGNSGIIALF